MGERQQANKSIWLVYKGATMKLLNRCKHLTLSQYITPDTDGIALDKKGNEYFFSNDGYNSYIRLNKFGSKISFGNIQINGNEITFTKNIIAA